jgi:NAD(P)-dependent dehydrogenase (short-subunit alcohol dehydrogenase family)
LRAAAREVAAAGGRGLLLPADVSDAEQVEAAAREVERRFGPIDIWVNDAMTSVFSPIKEMTPMEFKRVTEVTYLAYVYGTLAALKRMLPRDRGTIVHVGSALAYRSIPLQAAYCAAKHAILGFHTSLRTELLHDRSNVHTVMVQMPALNTPQFGWVKSRLRHKAQPVPPIYQPEVAARAIYYAAHQPQSGEGSGLFCQVKNLHSRVTRPARMHIPSSPNASSRAPMQSYFMTVLFQKDQVCAVPPLR